MIIFWQKLCNDEKRKIIAQMDKDDIKTIKEFKDLFNAEVILLEVKKCLVGV